VRRIPNAQGSSANHKIDHCMAMRSELSDRIGLSPGSSLRTKLDMAFSAIIAVSLSLAVITVAVIELLQAPKAQLQEGINRQPPS
jgi:hypothetical protein